MWRVPFLLLLPLVSQALDLRAPCTQPVHLGEEKCNKSASIRYYLDAETLTCLPFKYSGCGGNDNNFQSSSQCNLRCIPMDYLNCPANTPPTKRADGSVHCDVENKCPEGSTCRRGFVVGICCDNKAIERYNANQKPDCGHKKAVKDTSSDFPSILIGKSCDHNFCPKGSECHQGHFYAYCCK